MRMINAKSEFSKFLLFSSLFLLIIFILLMIQNVVRYGSYDTYNPWNSIIYLCITLIIFIPLIPITHAAGTKILERGQNLFWPTSIILSLSTIIIFFILSNGLLQFAGFRDTGEIYARRYFGREALFHLLVLGALFYTVRIKRNKNMLVSATLGRKEVTIQASLINWIEADDHYLKIHTKENSLIKRTTLEKIANELKPDFIRIHRKYLVNKLQIVGKEKNQRNEFVLLKSGERLKVGRSYRPFEI